MKKTNQLGGTVRIRREGLGLSQRSLAQKLGVAPAFVAFVESGRRKPSLKLVGRLADILGLDRRDFFITAHPEAEELVAETRPEKRQNTSLSWQRFVENHKLLARYHVTIDELRALEDLSLLGTVNSSKEFLAILTLIRDIPPDK
jgi:transcriptional regulator with XRE-family HTH domain